MAAVPPLAAMTESRLRDTLDEIHWSALNGNDKKGLLRFAVGIHMTGGHHYQQRTGSDVGSTTFDRMECALQAAGGGTKISISLAKRLLREKGAPELASRLSRMSRFRNSKAHPSC